jgi:hypothetical protein
MDDISIAKNVLNHIILSANPVLDSYRVASLHFPMDEIGGTIFDDDICMIGLELK